MKSIGFLLITVSLAVGVVSVVTAYTPALSLPDAALVGLRLNAPAGLQRDEQGDPVVGDGGALVPLVPTNTELTPELLAALRADGVQYVRVREFSWGRWPGRWWFALACVGLLVGATIVKRETRRQLAEAAGQRERAEGPETALDMMRREVAALLEQWPELTAAERLETTLERIGRVQREHVSAFAVARDTLVARLTLAGYAQLMDHFAAAERQINRAWSAAADGVEDEALVCLQRSAPLLELSIDRLRRG